MSLTENLLTELIRDGYSINHIGKNQVILTARSEQEYYIPNIIIQDLDILEHNLEQYIDTIKNTKLNFYQLDEKHDIKYYLFNLIKSLSNEDCIDFNSYVLRLISYIEDCYFEDLYFSKIGSVEPFNLLARRCEEFFGSETPFSMRFYLEKPGLRYEMPLVRYGISSEDVAYIYSVQRKRLYNNKRIDIKEINGMFKKVNKQVKNNRNITPSMLCSLALFIGMLHSEGITHIKADGFLTRRYGYMLVDGEEEKNRVLHNSIDKFNKMFLRLSDQFEGIDIVAYPFDIDSYLHITLRDNIYSKNDFLNSLYNTGKNYHKTLDSDKVLIKQYPTQTIQET